jgi:transcriptional regulator with GAF, ATPase, and Fis domain
MLSYYVSKASDALSQDAAAPVAQTTFGALAKVRYDLIGQDRALEQLFRVLGIQSQLPNVAPIVVLLCGPSGHGKTLVARRCKSTSFMKSLESEVL